MFLHFLFQSIITDRKNGESQNRKLVAMPRGTCLMFGPHSVGGRKEITETFRFVEIQEDKLPPKKARSNVVYSSGHYRKLAFETRRMEV